MGQARKEQPRCLLPSSILQAGVPLSSVFYQPPVGGWESRGQSPLSAKRRHCLLSVEFKRKAYLIFFLITVVAACLLHAGSSCTKTAEGKSEGEF